MWPAVVVTLLPVADSLVAQLDLVVEQSDHWRRRESGGGMRPPPPAAASSTRSGGPWREMEDLVEAVGV
jgi:hypothetical protein